MRVHFKLVYYGPGAGRQDDQSPASARALARRAAGSRSISTRPSSARCSSTSCHDRARQSERPHDPLPPLYRAGPGLTTGCRAARCCRGWMASRSSPTPHPAREQANRESLRRPRRARSRAPWGRRSLSCRAHAARVSVQQARLAHGAAALAHARDAQYPMARRVLERSRDSQGVAEMAAGALQDRCSRGSAGAGWPGARRQGHQPRFGRDHADEDAGHGRRAGEELVAAGRRPLGDAPTAHRASAEQGPAPTVPARAKPTPAPTPAHVPGPHLTRASSVERRSPLLRLCPPATVPLTPRS